jgi:hypothetical protein
VKKRTFLRAGVCLTAVIGLGLSARPAAAQMEDIITVKLPVAAMVGKVVLPAGEYTIRDLGGDGSSPGIEIRSMTGPSVSAIATQISVPKNGVANQTEVVLRREGNKYQIDKIWLRGQDRGYELLTPEAER